MLSSWTGRRSWRAALIKASRPSPSPTHKHKIRELEPEAVVVDRGGLKVAEAAAETLFYMFERLKEIKNHAVQYAPSRAHIKADEVVPQFIGALETEAIRPRHAADEIATGLQYARVFVYVRCNRRLLAFHVVAGIPREKVVKMAIIER